jgi:hypothetical protein
MAAGWDRFRLFTIGDLLVHRGRSLLSLTVMAVSAALLVAVFGISGSVTGSVDQLVAGLGGRAALEVSGITDAGFGQELLGPIAATPGGRAGQAGFGADHRRTGRRYRPLAHRADRYRGRPGGGRRSRVAGGPGRRRWAIARAMAL